MLSIFLNLILAPLSFATVQGQLQRFQVGQATQTPYASVGLINDFCSGTLIAPNKVLTAGHCTYEVDTKKAMPVTQITFARNGLRQQGFTFKVLKSTPHPIYKQTGSAEYDVAILTIDNQGITYPSLPLVRDLRSIPWEFNKDFFAMTTIGSIIGYPGDRLLGTMWYVACFLKQEISDINRIHYDCDTFGGMSGSPILVNLNNRPTLIGVHTNGGRDNSGLMLRPEILNFILNP